MAVQLDLRSAITKSVSGRKLGYRSFFLRQPPHTQQCVMEIEWRDGIVGPASRSQRFRQWERTRQARDVLAARPADQDGTAGAGMSISRGSSPGLSMRRIAPFSQPHRICFMRFVPFFPVSTKRHLDRLFQMVSAGVGRKPASPFDLHAAVDEPAVRERAPECRDDVFLPCRRRVP
jgi:hypothetical protein